MHESVRTCVKTRHLDVLARAEDLSEKRLSAASGAIAQFLADNGQSPDEMCFAVTGSVGRREALEASDLDLIPIAADADRLRSYEPLDKSLRTHLKAALGVKVSAGEDLTKACHVGELTEPDSIGGASDGSAPLTKRVLLLTESAQAGGSLTLNGIRSRIIDAYSAQERTSGRHVLSLCNDISRYYKTLCIEYKAKIDEEGKDWCTRNVKLRHSRKLWFFANMVAIATLAEDFPQGDAHFKAALLASFETSPIERLAASLGETQCLPLGRLLESYALFLDFMSKQGNRDALAKVEHEKRYDMTLGNPFPMMKFNSDLIHTEIMGIIEELGISKRSRIMGWFML